MLKNKGAVDILCSVSTLFTTAVIKIAGVPEQLRKVKLLVLNGRFLLQFCLELRRTDLVGAALETLVTPLLA